MRRYLEVGLLLSLFAGLSLAADDVSSAVAGTVKSVDEGAKTAVVKTSEGTEHTFHFVGRTVEHGAEATAKGSKDAFEGVKEGDNDRRRALHRKGHWKKPPKKWITSAKAASKPAKW